LDLFRESSAKLFEQQIKFSLRLSCGYALLQATDDRPVVTLVSARRVCAHRHEHVLRSEVFKTRRHDADYNIGLVVEEYWFADNARI
jgi:hypothetical protein